MTETNYNNIRQSFIDFLKNKTDFTDYNFSGSALSTLIDILSYNTQNLALQSNLTLSECFLDSANQRGSVVSRAKELGYTPTSSSAALANITLSFSVSGNPLQYVVPKYTTFASQIDNTSYNFTTLEDVIVDRSNNLYTVDVDLVQGKVSTYNYTVDLTNLIKKFIIPSKTVDTKYLNVYVNNQIYTNFDDYNIGEIDDSSFVYYIFENIDGYYEIYFGDGVLGKPVYNGDIVSLVYLSTNEDSSNGCQRFSINSTLPNVSNIQITTNQAAQGGSAKQSVDSIKFNAPLSYQSQGRAVTSNDFISKIISQGGIEDAVVWGGEDNDPPYYGKVFAAIKPTAGKYISNIKKEQIKSIIKSKYGVLGIRPEIVDASYIDVGVSATIIYSGKTYTTSNNLNSVVLNTITDFFDKSSSKFGSTVYHSKLVKAIEDSDSAIISSSVNFTLSKYSVVTLGSANVYQVNFNNYLTPGTIRSNSFYINNVVWKFKDQPTGTYPYTAGKLVVYREENGDTIYYSQDAGTIDYTTGKIEINSIVIDSFVGGGYYLTISADLGSYTDNTTTFTDYNIYTNNRDQLIRLDTSNIEITLLPDNTK